MYQIEVRNRYGQWDADEVGDAEFNQFETREEAEAEITELRKVDAFNNLREWKDAEYRVIEITDDDPAVSC